MTWVDLSSAFAYGTKLTSTQMQNLRDNIAAAFAKDSGSPELAADYINFPMVDVGVTGRVPLDTKSLVGSAYTDFTSYINSNYGAYEFKFFNVIPSADNAELRMRTSTDGGASYDAASSYKRGLSQITYAGSADFSFNENDDGAQVTLSIGIGSTANERGVCGTVILFDPGAAGRTSIFGNMVFDNYNSDIVDCRGVGITKLATDVDAVRFLFDSGNFESGTITMYGIPRT